MAIIKAQGGIIEAHHADPIWVREHFENDIEILRTGEIPKKSDEEIAKANELLLRIWAVWGIALLACITYGYNPWFIGVIVIGFIFCIGATGVLSGHNSGRSLWLTARNNGFRYDSDSDVTYIAQLQLMGLSLIPKELKEKAEADCRILKGHTMYRYPITYEKIHLSRYHNWLNATISFKLVDRVRTLEVTTEDRRIVIEIAKLKKYEKYVQGIGRFIPNTEMDGRAFNKLFSSKTVFNNASIRLSTCYERYKGELGRVTKPQAFRELSITIHPKTGEKENYRLEKTVEDWEIVELVDERFNPDIYRAIADDKALAKAIEAGVI